jgi:ribosome-binding factor A
MAGPYRAGTVKSPLPSRAGAICSTGLQKGGNFMDRIDRISEEVKRELSDIIQNHIKDPRLPPFVSVTGVRVTKDLKHAKTFVSVLGTEEQKLGALKALQSAAGYIRHEIGQRVKLRFTPEFHFHLDDSIEHGMHISKLISDTMAAQNAVAASAAALDKTQSDGQGGTGETDES